MTALRLIRVLDVLHEHASALESARALSSRPWHPLASRPVEKSRLTFAASGDAQPGGHSRRREALIGAAQEPGCDLV